MVVKTSSPISLAETATQDLLDWAIAITDSGETYFHKAQLLARKLGAHYQADGSTQVGFWVPDLAGDVIQSERAIYLEVFTPLSPVDLRQPEQTIQFRRDRISLPQQGEYVWGVISGLQPGRQGQLGSLYWLKYLDQIGHLHTIRDVVPYSLPYGIFAPAELYDMEQVQQNRADLDYFRQTGVTNPESDAEIPRIPAPHSILQLHVSTASEEGTLAGLTRVYQRISQKLAAHEPLTPAEENYLGYDAVQLLPLEPTIEYRSEISNLEHEFFSIVSIEKIDDSNGKANGASSAAPPTNGAHAGSKARDHDSEAVPEDVEMEITDTRSGVVESHTIHNISVEDIDTEGEYTVEVILRKPNTHNWGYDIPILGSSATNPAILGELRPDEMIDFVATLHNFSQGAIAVIYDLVYGHADNQSEELISRQFLKGPNMYGQDLNHQLPAVRALLLEMQRRKINTGADGIRVDGGQDFRWFNPLSGRVEQDDAYLVAMSDVVQEIGDSRRLLFTIFEDGRPWPQEGWEDSSTYRDLIELKPESYQWGPLIFAHNTPTLQKFWDHKWRRVGEVMFQGENWITGCANHDTVRRGNQIDPQGEINWNLGKTLPEVLHNAYDNPAVKLWVYGFSPGLPMEFINALVKAPWVFFRNTDERYGVKVASEEVGFLDWQIEPQLYEEPFAFPRLKALGFNDYSILRQFAQALRSAMVQTDYDLEVVAQICQHCLGDDPNVCEVPSLGRLNQPEQIDFLKTLDVPSLKAFAMAFMEDAHEMCKISRYEEQVDAQQAQFGLNLRLYRREHAWLRGNLTGLDRFNRISDAERTLFYGLRAQPIDETEQGPQGPQQQVAMVAHMGGAPIQVTLADWLQLDLNEWKVAIATPGLAEEGRLDELHVFELKDSEGVLLEKILTDPQNSDPQDSDPSDPTA